MESLFQGPVCLGGLRLTWDFEHDDYTGDIFNQHNLKQHEESLYLRLYELPPGQRT